MSHHHNHTHSSQKNILLAFLLNLFFAIFEAFGGFFTNSIAIISDALHDLGDALALGIAYWLEKFSTKKADNKFNFGYQRFSLLSAVFISSILIIGIVFVIYASVGRLLSPQPTNANGMTFMAFIGLIINGYAAYKTHQGHSISERAISLHLLEDVLGWASVLVVSIVMYFFNAPYLDPLLSIAISLWIAYNAIHNLTSSFFILLQGNPINTETLSQNILQINGVSQITDLKIWSLNGECHCATIVISISNPLLAQDVKASVKTLCSAYHITHTTIEFN